ncbi:hypothetical protein WME94_55830 [Sorangium sp. So ce429]
MVDAGVLEEGTLAAAVLPAALASALLESKPARRLQLLVSGWGASVALTPWSHQVLEHTDVEIPLITFESESNPNFTLRDEPELRVAFVNYEDRSSDRDAAQWTWGALGVHELGHMLGLVHPNINSFASDDYEQNLMTAMYELGLPASTWEERLHIAQSQCLIMGIDPNGFAEP